MGLVPLDLPTRLRDRGLTVVEIKDWQTRGGSADHRAGILHHTASGTQQGIQSILSELVNGKPDVSGPLANLCVARDATVYVIARNKSNNAGKNNPTAVQEAIDGHANLTPAKQRGLADDGSRNAKLFAIEIVNNGVGEMWNRAVIDAAATCSAVVAEAMGWSAGNWTTHRAVTKRKIDPNYQGDWHYEISSKFAGSRRNRLMVGLPAHLTKRGAVQIVRTPTGEGYYIVSSDGGVFTFGDAQFHGSKGGEPLNAPVVGMAVRPQNDGYALVAADGGVFCFGPGAQFRGSLGHLTLPSPIVGIEYNADGEGYWLLDAVGHVFPFEAVTHGDAVGLVHA